MNQTVFIFNWSSLQVDALDTIHACYIEAFKAIASDKAYSWSKEDTAKLQGVSPEVIWSDTTLWGEYGETARKAFYDCFKEMPMLPLRPGVKQMLHRLDDKGCHVYIVSMKTKELMLKEIGALGAAALARGFFGTTSDKLKRLDDKGYHFYIASMKMKERMLKKSGELGAAALGRGCFGTTPGSKLTKEQLLQQVLNVIGAGRIATVVAHAGYREAAQAVGCNFILADEETFELLGQ